MVLNISQKKNKIFISWQHDTPSYQKKYILKKKKYFCTTKKRWISFIKKNKNFFIDVTHFPTKLFRIWPFFYIRFSPKIHFSVSLFGESMILVKGQRKNNSAACTRYFFLECDIFLKKDSFTSQDIFLEFRIFIKQRLRKFSGLLRDIRPPRITFWKIYRKISETVRKITSGFDGGRMVGRTKRYFLH